MNNLLGRVARIHQFGSLSICKWLIGSFPNSMGIHQIWLLHNCSALMIAPIMGCQFVANTCSLLTFFALISFGGPNARKLPFVESSGHEKCMSANRNLGFSFQRKFPFKVVPFWSFGLFWKILFWKLQRSAKTYKKRNRLVF